MFDRTLLHPVWRFAEETLRPCASAADQADICGPVRGHIHALARQGFFGLGVGQEYGGLGADETTRHEFTEILASACGVTAFTQQQLLNGVGVVATAQNNALKSAFLPSLATGEALCGIALSHLRRSGPSSVLAEPTAGGYRVSGTIPWITAWEILDCFVLGAEVVGAGKHVFLLVDKHVHGDSLRPGPSLALSVMNASGTREVAVQNLFIGDDAVLSVCEVSDLRMADRREITTHTALPLGCARGAASYLRALAQQKQSPALSQTAMALTWEIDQCRREALTWNCDCAKHPEYVTYALRARASALILALRAGHTAVAASGEEGLRRDAAPQRLLREAQFYATVVQTPDVQEATMDLLLSPLWGL